MLILGMVSNPTDDSDAAGNEIKMKEHQRNKNTLTKSAITRISIHTSTVV